MITKNQVGPLIFVYTRREKAAEKEMLLALQELKETQANVAKHEKTVASIKEKLQDAQAKAFSGTVSDIQQRQRTNYWLNYDMEDIEFRLSNSRYALIEQQATYKKNRTDFIKAKRLREFVTEQSRKLQKNKRNDLDRIDEETFNESYREPLNA